MLASVLLLGNTDFVEESGSTDDASMPRDPEMYGNFDNVSQHFSHIFKCRTPHHPHPPTQPTHACRVTCTRCLVPMRVTHVGC